MSFRVAMVIACVATIGCTANSVERPRRSSSNAVETAPASSTESPSAAGYALFQQRYSAGASCAELVTIKNTADPKSPEIETMNYMLRGVQCYSPASIRKSLVDAGPKDQPIDPSKSFTTVEYRMYRAVIDSSTAIPESDVLAAVGKEYGHSAIEVRNIARKVSEVLAENDWHGNPSTEMMHATDR